MEQDWGFTGREVDDETGVIYYRARHYDPAGGRFIQSDPLGFAAGDLNLYAYTWNDPLNWSDPSGLSPSAEKGGTTAAAAGMARGAVKPVSRGANCLSRKISTALVNVGEELAEGRDVGRGRFVPKPGCRTEFVAPKCTCGVGPGGLIGGASFPEGTRVLTPNGRVPIETLREGDMVIARDEDTGQSGVFSVIALMSRQATDVLWLTLEGADGQTSRMGVTSEHPMFMVYEGWTIAGDLRPGDAIRNSNFKELRVLAIENEAAPIKVHNLEIAQAHTYFAGDLDAWGHNSGRPPAQWWSNLLNDPKQPSFLRGCLLQQKNRGVPPSRWRLPPGFDQGHFPSNRGKHNLTSRPELSCMNRARPGITGRNPKWR